MMPTITPFLWFDSDLAEPIEFYTSIFPNASTGYTQRAGDDGPIFTAEIELCGQKLMLLNGGPAHAGFTEAISLFISVETQAEIDELWDRLLAGGGEPSQCGWLKDRYGLSWQVVPSMLGTVLGSPDRRRAQQAMDAMMQMVKLDIAELRAAYDR
jgi:predicted 3-demethylubiquinone-9 3-methyltransferase (glyoxalase superfamily)